LTQKRTLQNSLTAKTINPFRQLRERQKIDYSFWRNLRQDGCRQAKLYIGQLPWVMGICSERDPRPLFVRYLQETVTKILAICVTIDFDGFIQPGGFSKNLVPICL
jgi:hypothetical protein